MSKRERRSSEKTIQPQEIDGLRTRLAALAKV